MKKILSISFVIISSIIGVGFISGKEIYSFFGRFGFTGIVFALVAGVLFGVVIWYFLSKSKEVNETLFSEKTQNFQNRLEKVCKNDKNIAISAIFEKVLQCSYVILSAVMIGGFRLLLLKFLPAIVVEFLIYIVLIILLMITHDGEKKIVPISRFFVLIFIVVFAILFGKNVVNIKVDFLSRVNNLYVLCIVVFYVSMNVFTCFSVLTKMGLLVNKKECVWIGVVCGGVIALLLVCGSLLLQRRCVQSEMPLLDIAGGDVLGCLYIGLTVFGLLTTLVSTYHGSVSVGGEISLKKRLLSLYFSYMLSSFGFSNLVEKVYPVLGFFAMLVLVVIFLILKNRKFAKN